MLRTLNLFLKDENCWIGEVCSFFVHNKNGKYVL